MLLLPPPPLPLGTPEVLTLVPELVAAEGALLLAVLAADAMAAA